MTAPLCKDCAHFLPSLYEHEDNSDYWLKVKLIGARCNVKTVPDLVYGTSAVVYPGDDQRVSTALNMRMSGPCGMGGRFFEPKGEKK